MPENDRLVGGMDETELGFVEREATPRLLMKLGIQLHLAGLSLSNTVSIFGIFGVEQARSTVHNWIHKADLQPKDSHSPDHVAVDETAIHLGDERYWLYAAVDSESNSLLYMKLEPVRNNIFAHEFFTNSARNTASSTSCFSSIEQIRSTMHALGTASILDTNTTEIGTASNVSSER